MRRLALGLVLACALSGMARAGEIHSTGAVAPPTPTVTGEIHTTGEAVAEEVPSTGGTDSTTVLTIIVTLISSVR
jgi:hypothetical protein